MTFFEYIAEEVREHLAALGFRTHRGGDRPRRAARHRARRSTTGRPSGLDLAPDPARARARRTAPRGATRRAQDHGLDKALDNELIALARRRARATASRCASTLPVRNVNRTVGTMLGHEVTKRYGGNGLPDGTIDVTLTGSAGQSFGAFLPARHHAAAGGRRQRLRRQGPVRRPGRRPPGPRRRRSRPRSNVIAGNVIGYGATSGEVFLRGMVGERFCVRNSGATAVVEGVGDHGCEYMTGGRVVVLGPTGRNFAAGMSGGMAYVLDLRPRAGQPRAGRPRAASPDDADAESARAAGPARRGDRLRRGREAAGRLGRPRRDRFTKVMPRDYRRGAARPADGAATRASTPTARGLAADHGGGSWLTRRAS